MILLLVAFASAGVVGLRESPETAKIPWTGNNGR
jgi:hypothetical protein